MAGRDSFRGSFSRGSDGEEFDPGELLARAGYGEEAPQYVLPGETLVREGRGPRETLADSGAVGVITGERILFAVDNGRRVDEAADIHHCDVKAANFESGLLSSEFVVKDWDGPSYRLDPDGDSDLFEEATDFLDRASACWGTAESLLDELDVKVTNIDNYTGNDSFEPVARALVEAGETIEEIETKIADAGLTDVLGPRLDRTRADLRDGHIEARRTRASKLIDEGGEDLDGGEYEVASQKFQRANEHLEAAESVAGQHEMAETLEAIESQRERLKDRLSEMVARPVQRAEEATSRGLRAAGPDRVDAYEAAIEQYHEALELCRKHDLNPEHDPETLKFSIELLAAGVVDARREWIDEIEGDADTLSLAGQIEDGRERYQEALEETRRTLKIAEQFEAPDPEPFEQAVVDLERKLDNIGEF